MNGTNEIDLASLDVPGLLKLHALIGDELRARKIVRSSNNPCADLAEYLFCKALDLDQVGNSYKNVDAISRDGKIRYQIKGRRITKHNKSRPLLSGQNANRFNWLFICEVSGL